MEVDVFAPLFAEPAWDDAAPALLPLPPPGLPGSDAAATTSPRAPVIGRLLRKQQPLVLTACALDAYGRRVLRQPTAGTSGVTSSAGAAGGGDGGGNGGTAAAAGSPTNKTRHAYSVHLAQPLSDDDGDCNSPLMRRRRANRRRRQEGGTSAARRPPAAYTAPEVAVIARSGAPTTGPLLVVGPRAAEGASRFFWPALILAILDFSFFIVTAFDLDALDPSDLTRVLSYAWWDVASGVMLLLFTLFVNASVLASLRRATTFNTTVSLCILQFKLLLLVAMPNVFVGFAICANIGQLMMLAAARMGLQVQVVDLDRVVAVYDNRNGSTEPADPQG